MERPFSANEKLNRSSGIPEQSHGPQSTECRTHVGRGQRLPLPPSSMGFIMSLWRVGKDQGSERGKCLRNEKLKLCTNLGIMDPLLPTQPSWQHPTMACPQLHSEHRAWAMPSILGPFPGAVAPGLYNSFGVIIWGQARWSLLSRGKEGAYLSRS